MSNSELKIFEPRNGVKIAYHELSGKNPMAPGVIFLGGFRSDMTGTKATYLEEQCKKSGQKFLRFDYQGHGQSSTPFEDCNISTWLQDTLDIFDALTKGPYIVVGSSMGGWLALLLALQRPLRVAGLITIAAAPDFTEDIYHKEFTDAQRAELDSKGVITLPSDFTAPYQLKKSFFEDGKKHLILDEEMSITCPVRLLHSKDDDVVPWQKTKDIMARISARNTRVFLQEDAGHRMSRPQDLDLLGETVRALSAIHQEKLMNK